MKYIKQLESKIKQIIIRAVKENIDKHTIYFMVENYINTSKFDDDIYVCLIEDVINKICKINPTDEIIKKLIKEKFAIINHFKFFSNKMILSHPGKIISNYDFKCEKYRFLIDDNFTFFSHIYCLIDKIKFGYEYAIYKTS